MPERLKRIYGSHHLHFIAFSCYQRRPLLASAESRNFVVQALQTVRREYGFKLVGYVVMREHVHLLISEPVRGTPSTVLKMLKQRTSHRLRSEFSDGERPTQFWQHRFYDFNVWSRKKKVEKLAYMHQNPLKRGLMDDPKDWPWNSYAFYQGRGDVLIQMDSRD
jgi:putative transposase